MLKRFLSGTIFWTLIVGGFFMWTQTSGRAFQRENAGDPPPASQFRPPMPQVPLDPGVAQQMLALEHHARVNMLLYAGEVTGAQRASAARPLNVIALSVSTGR
jgi:hypothetical protein